MVELHVERTIAASPDRVFDWLVDPVHLASAPLIFKAGYVTGVTAGAGAVREAIAAGMWLREEITAYDAPRSYSYRIVRSFPTFDHDAGTLVCTPCERGTHVDWSTSYTHPIYVGGKALEALTGRMVRKTFSAILAACAEAVEAQGNGAG